MRRTGIVLAAAFAIASAQLHASYRVVLTAGGDERGPDSFRCVSRVTGKTGAVFLDRTADGMRVGQLLPVPEDLSRADRVRGIASAIDPEDRIAVIRPVFADSITGVRGFRVVAVTQKTLLAPTSTFLVTDLWNSGTPAKDIFDIKRETTPVLPGQLVELFQRVLDTGNNSSSTNGLYLSGTASLRSPAIQPLLFDVLLEVPLPQGRTPDSTSIHPIITVTATAEVRNIVIGNDVTGAPVTQRLNVVSFSANRRGRATIFAQESNGFLRIIQKDLGVVAGLTYTTVIRNEALRAGQNQILVSVADNDLPDVPPDFAARGFTAPLTLVNPP